MSAPISQKHEIDHRTMKLIVGVIAITLGPLTCFLSHQSLPSISASYEVHGATSSVFVGFLFAIASFLAAYNGEILKEKRLSKFAALAAIGVAMCPCGCLVGCGEPSTESSISAAGHYVSATVMFAVLAIFCRIFCKRARMKGHPEAVRRSHVYLVCEWLIWICIGVLGINAVTQPYFCRMIPNITFWGEQVALLAFGIAWLMASHILPFFNRSDEQHHLF